MKDWETFQAAYKIAPADIRLIISSSHIPNTTLEILPQIDKKTRNLIIKVVSEYVLKITTMQELLEFLLQNGIQIDQSTIDTIVLKAMSKSQADVANVTPEPQEHTNYSMNASPVPQSSEGVNTYSSSQDAVLKPPQNPNPPTSDAPRWGQL